MGLVFTIFAQTSSSLTAPNNTTFLALFLWLFTDNEPVVSKSTFNCTQSPKSTETWEWSSALSTSHSVGLSQDFLAAHPTTPGRRRRPPRWPWREKASMTRRCWRYCVKVRQRSKILNPPAFTGHVFVQVKLNNSGSINVGRWLD